MQVPLFNPENSMQQTDRLYSSHRLRRGAVGALVLLFALPGACTTYGPTDIGDRGGYPAGDSAVRVLSSIALTTTSETIELGETTHAISVPQDQFGTVILAAAPVFGSATPDVAIVNPADGRIFGVSAGTATITVTIGAITAQKTIKVVASPIRINEVQSNGNAPGGWVELVNPTNADIDVSGFVLTNSDLFQSVTLPHGTIIRAGKYLMVLESDFPGGLNAIDGVHLFSEFGVQGDSFAWIQRAQTSYARCPNMTGPFAVSAVETFNFSNACNL
ncbi:MAG: lamin tail domain-containing protein [Gemmatimonadaceae bacterium]